ncbi:MAG: nucleotide exchange factor GrpE [Acidobacteria bacterium]|nr:nucleotide exchange factor GrpE [Acidobacteriota bacterium]
MTDRSEILGRLEQWLDSALEREEPPPGLPAEILTGEEAPEESSPTDLYTMWAAVTALTQEVKLQGRAFKQLSETMEREFERRADQQTLDGLLDLRERLLRGLDSVRLHEELKPAFWDRIFRGRWRRIRHSFEVVRALEEGYRLSLEGLDDLLARSHVRPMECEGQAFDPRSMSAVDVEETDEADPGTVLAVYRTGYERNGEVYRPARVRVAQARKERAPNE